MNTLLNLNEIKPGQNCPPQRVLIIASRANELIVSRLIEGASRACHKAGIKANDQYLIRVDGALEIPLALKMAAKTGHFTTYVVLGAVIKGHTDHYEHVARMANDGVLSVALEYNLVLGNKILTVHSLEHALERADGPAGNAGYDAAMAALNLYETLWALQAIKREQ